MEVYETIDKSINAKTGTKCKVSRHDVPSADFSEIRKRIGYLSTLKPGWDGYSASPISSHVIDNVNTLLSNIDEESLNGWRALPEINGTISLQNDALRAGIQIGDTAFSYFVIKGNNVTGDDNVSFSIPNFINILRDING